MLNQLGKWVTLSSPTTMSPILSNNQNALLLSPVTTTLTIFSAVKASNPKKQRALLSTCCRARRRVRYDIDDDDDESYGYNEEIAMLEMYSQSARGEALIVNAIVDGREVEVLIFKGFSSSLSHGTVVDPSRSVVPARAVIKAIDRIKGPFDPSNIEYLENGLTWEAFKSRLPPT